MKKRKRLLPPYGIIAPCEIPESADKLLNEYWDIANSLDIKTFLIYGTCLGFIRDGGYIEHDNDVDIGILGKIGKFGIKLIENGFVKKKRWPRRHYHFLKYDILFDIHVGFPGSHWKYFKSFDKITYKGRVYNVPHPVEEYLETLYGNWKVRKFKT